MLLRAMASGALRLKNGNVKSMAKCFKADQLFNGILDLMAILIDFLLSLFGHCLGHVRGHDHGQWPWPWLSFLARDRVLPHGLGHACGHGHGRGQGQGHGRRQGPWPWSCYDNGL